MPTEILHKWLIGEAPWSFALEVLLRFLFIYLALLLALRLMGRRFAGQLSIVELAIMVMLGAAIGPPLQTPEEGVLPTIVLLIALLGCYRLLSWLTFRFHALEKFSQGDVTLLVTDGRLALKPMRRAELSRDRIFSELRALNVQHLGEVRRAWLEPSGSVSLMRYRQPRVGLWLLPEQDKEFDKRVQIEDSYACSNCGYVVRQEAAPQEACRYCQSRSWQPAVKRLGADKLWREMQEENTKDKAEKAE